MSAFEKKPYQYYFKQKDSSANRLTDSRRSDQGATTNDMKQSYVNFQQFQESKRKTFSNGLNNSSLTANKTTDQHRISQNSEQNKTSSRGPLYSSAYSKGPSSMGSTFLKRAISPNGGGGQFINQNDEKATFGNFARDKEMHRQSFEKLTLVEEKNPSWFVYEGNTEKEESENMYQNKDSMFSQIENTASLNPKFNQSGKITSGFEDKFENFKRNILKDRPIVSEIQIHENPDPSQQSNVHRNSLEQSLKNEFTFHVDNGRSCSKCQLIEKEWQVLETKGRNGHQQILRQQKYIKQLQEKQSDLKASNQEYAKKVESLERQLQNQIDQNKSIQDFTKDLRNSFDSKVSFAIQREKQQVKEYRAQLQDKHMLQLEEISKLKKLVAFKDENLQKEKESRVSSEEQKADIEKELRRSELQKENLEKDRDFKKRQQQRIEASFINLEEVNQNLLVNNQQLKAQNMELQEQIKVERRAALDSLSSLKKLTERLQEYQLSQAQFENERTQMRSLLQSTESEVEIQQKQTEKNATMVAVLENKIKELEGSLEKSARMLSRDGSEDSSSELPQNLQLAPAPDLKEELEKHKSTIDSLTYRESELEVELESTITQLHELGKELSTERANSQLLADRIQEQKQRIQLLEAQEAEPIESSNQNCDSTNSHIKALNDEIEHKEDLLKECEVQLEESMTLSIALKNQLQKVRREQATIGQGLGATESPQQQYFAQLQQFYNEILEVFGLDLVSSAMLTSRSCQQLHQDSNRKASSYLQLNSPLDSEEDSDRCETTSLEGNDNLTCNIHEDAESTPLQDTLKPTDQGQGQAQAKGPLTPHRRQSSGQSRDKNRLNEVLGLMSYSQEEVLKTINQWIRKLEKQSAFIGQNKEKISALNKKVNSLKQEIEMLEVEKLEIHQKYESFVLKLEGEMDTQEARIQELTQKTFESDFFISRLEETIHEANKECLKFRTAVANGIKWQRQNTVYRGQVLAEGVTDPGFIPNANTCETLGNYFKEFYQHQALHQQYLKSEEYDRVDLKRQKERKNSKIEVLSESLQIKDSETMELEEIVKNLDGMVESEDEDEEEAMSEHTQRDMERQGLASKQQ